MRTLTVLPLLLVIQPSLALATSGVVVLGEDSADGGRVQLEVEAAFKAADIKVEPLARFASFFGEGEKPALDAEVTKRVNARIQAAIANLDGLNHAKAIAELDAADAELQTHPYDFADLRRKALLWRIEIHIAAEQPDKAKLAAMRLIRTDRNPKVDPGMFSPDVRTAVRDARGEVAKIVVRLTGHPAGAAITLDGKPVTSPIDTSAGAHYLRVVAPGTRVFQQRVTWNQPTIFSVPLSLAPSEPIASALQSLMTESAPSNAESLAAALNSAKLDGLILVSVKAPHTVVVWNAKDSTAARETDLKDLAAVTAWVGSDRDTGDTTVMPKPRLPSSRWAFETGALVGGGLSRKELSYDPGGFIEASSAMTVTQLTGKITKGRFVSDLRFIFDYRDLTGTTVNYPDAGISEDLGGGWTLGFRGSAGYTLRLARNRLSLIPLVLIGVEHHEADEIYDAVLPNADEESIGIFPSYQRGSAGVGFEAGWDFSGPTIGLGVGFSPFSLINDSSERKVGKTVELYSPGFLARLSVQVPIRGWVTGVEVEGQRIFLEFTGRGNSRLLPTPVDSEVVASWVTGSVTVGRRF